MAGGLQVAHSIAFSLVYSFFDFGDCVFKLVHPPPEFLQCFLGQFDEDRYPAFLFLSHFGWLSFLVRRPATIQRHR